MDDTANASVGSAPARALPGAEAAESEDYFRDNMDHLLALEQEALLHLELAHMRNVSSQSFAHSGKRPSGGVQHAFVPARPVPIEEAGPTLTLAELEELSLRVAAINQAKENRSLSNGVTLFFARLCQSYALDDFERHVVLLLFVAYTSVRFKQAFSRGISSKNDGENGSMTVGDLLTMLCRDYREQLRCRRYFSIAASLTKEEILLMPEVLDETTDILIQPVHLHERIVRFIAGDDCFYDASLKGIVRERGDVSLDQVIMAEELKADLVRLVTSFVRRESIRDALGIDAFFGYGTGMILLFYGPSGTGKTMLAKALANMLNKMLFSLNVKALERARETGCCIQNIFREARLQEGIVFFDECDDDFAEGEYLSRILLTEIEKATGITILATNKPFRLDPSLERRITMKVPFTFPDEALRERIWRALLPKAVELGADVDLSELAKTYIYTGGLIKNTLFTAINTAIGKNGSGSVTLTMEDLRRAADYQATSAFEKYTLGESYSSSVSIDELPLRSGERQQLKGLASAYQRLRADGYGLNVMVSASDFSTAIEAVEAVACACELKVKKYSLSEVLSLDCTRKFMDPLDQKEISALDYAFAEGAGFRSLSLFVDYDGQFVNLRSDSDKKEEGESPSFLLRAFLDNLRDYEGFVFVVTGPLRRAALLPEFHQLIEIHLPPEELQIRQWEKHLKNGHASKEDIVDLVERCPMHLHEIDFIARQAAIRAVILGQEGKLTLEHITEVIERYRTVRNSPVLFGASKKGEASF
jgi:SpoVK/Ycf46/Vps4 family AAA+-type ATPase